MFNVDISTAVFFYVATALGVLFILWIFFEKTTTLPKFVREKADVWECSICAYTYVDSKHQEISQCPQCKSYNKKSKEDRLI